MYPVSMGGGQPQSPYPPQQAPTQRAPSPSYPSPTQGRAQQPAAAAAQPQIAPESMRIAQIDTLSDAEVEAMLASDEKLTAFVRGLPFVQDYMLRAEAVARLQAEVEALPAATGSPALDAARAELQEKRAEYERKSAERQQRQAQLAPPVLVERLGDAARAVDAECDDLAQAFLAGGMTPQQFAEQYQQKRIVYHSRSAKKEAIMRSAS